VSAKSRFWTNDVLPSPAIVVPRTVSAKVKSATAHAATEVVTTAETALTPTLYVFGFVMVTVTGVLEPGAAPETGALVMTRLSAVVAAFAAPEPEPFAVQYA
jgi:hypothetical protein